MAIEQAIIVRRDLDATLAEHLGHVVRASSNAVGQADSNQMIPWSDVGRPVTAYAVPDEDTLEGIIINADEAGFPWQAAAENDELVLAAIGPSVDIAQITDGLDPYE